MKKKPDVYLNGRHVGELVKRRELALCVTLSIAATPEGWSRLLRNYQDKAVFVIQVGHAFYMGFIQALSMRGEEECTAIVDIEISPAPASSCAISQPAQGRQAGRQVL